MDNNLGLRAEGAAPRSYAPRDTGRPGRVRPRQEARLVSTALRRLPRNPAEEPTEDSTARFARSALRHQVEHLPASRSAFTSTAPRAASARLGTASVPVFGAPGQAGILAKGKAYWN